MFIKYGMFGEGGRTILKSSFFISNNSISINNKRRKSTLNT
jgi:hypothetical protein